MLRMDHEAPARFVVDVMLGSLARWLRRLGYDADYANDRDDRELVRIARAEDRVLLTRDRALAARHGARTLLIASQALDEQMAQVKTAFPLPPGERTARCSECNAVLESVTPEEVAARVPVYVRRTYAQFQRCPDCARVYWPGSHREHMTRRLGW